MAPIPKTEYIFKNETKNELFDKICPDPLPFLRECLETTHKALYQNTDFKTRKLTFIVKSMEGVAHTIGLNNIKEIHISMEYLEKFGHNKSLEELVYEFNG